MTDKQIMEEIEKGIRLGRKEAYVDIFCIVANMYGKDSSISLSELMNILHDKIFSAEVKDYGKE